MTRTTKGWLFGVVWVHTLVVILHGLSHIGNGYLPTSPVDNTFIFATNLIGPLAALWLLNLGRNRAGALLLAVSLAGALVYGLVNHFLVSGPDNAFGFAPGGWQLIFLLTSLLLVVVELAAIGVALWSLAVSRPANKLVSGSFRGLR